MDIIAPYRVTVLVMGLSGLLFLLQLAIVDLVGIKRRHTPGFTIEQNHDSFLFRASRALANSNESAAIFVLLALFSIFSSASAAWLNAFSVMYFLGRAGHMVFYYGNLQIPRSMAFAVSFVGLLGIFFAGLHSWL